MFNGKNILITGGTGSFGRQFVEVLLKDFRPHRVAACSRDEYKRFEMAQVYGADCMRHTSSAP